MYNRLLTEINNFCSMVYSSSTPKILNAISAANLHGRFADEMGAICVLHVMFYNIESLGADNLEADVSNMIKSDVHGIIHEKTPHKTLQLNGLVERMNRTLIERVRCMLSEAKLPKHLWGEALYTVVHVINLSPVVALNIEVPKKIWFGKYVKLYDPVEKKLVKRCDVQFMKDQTIEDIDKVKKTTPEKDNSLFKIDPVHMPVHDLDTIENNVQNGEQHDYVGNQQFRDVFDVPLDDDVKEEQDMSQDENSGDAPKPPLVLLRKSNRQRQPTIRYPSDEYVTLTDGEEPEC
ncbi:hypothetical protein CR513_33841, partial [Mucuna pruriens]